MENNRRGISQTINPAEVAFFKRIELVVVADEQIPLQYRNRQAAEEPAQADQHAGEHSEHRTKRRQVGVDQIGRCGRHQERKGESFPGQIGIGRRNDFAFAEIKRCQMMGDVIQLGQHDQEQHKPCAILRSGKLEVCEVAKPEYHQHESPLGGADAAQEADRSLIDQPRERQEQKYVDRNKDDEHPVPFNIDPVELHWNGQVSPKIQSAVGFSGADHGEILLQREEGKHHEGQQRNDRIK